MKKITVISLLFLLCMAMNLNAMKRKAQAPLDSGRGHKGSEIIPSEKGRDDREEEEGEVEDKDNNHEQAISLPASIWLDIIRFSDEDALAILSGATVDPSIQILKECVGDRVLAIEFKRSPQSGLFYKNMFGMPSGNSEQKQAFYSYIKRRLSLRTISKEINPSMKDLFPQIEDIGFNIIARHRYYVHEFLRRLVKKKISLNSGEYELLNLFCRYGYTFDFSSFANLIQSSKNQNYGLSQFFLDNNVLAQIRHKPLVKAIFLNDIQSLSTIISLCPCNFKKYGFSLPTIFEPIANNISALVLAASVGNINIFKLVFDHFNDHSNHEKELGNLQAPDLVNQAFIFACKYNSKDVVRFFINEGLDVNFLCSSIENHNTPLVKAAANDSLDAMDQLLNCEKANVNITDNQGNTPLIAAASKGHLRAVEELLCYEAKINEANSKGDTALLVAIFCENPEVANTLLQHPDININCQNRKGWTPLINAASAKSLKMLNVLLKSPKAPQLNPNIKNRNGFTALMMAIKRNEDSIYNQDCESIDLIASLLTHPDIDIEATDNQGRTALMLAQELRYDDIVKKLTEYQSNKFLC